MVWYKFLSKVLIKRKSRNHLRGILTFYRVDNVKNLWIVSIYNLNLHCEIAHTPFLYCLNDVTVYYRMKELKRIFSFRPYYRTVIWGGDRIGRYKGVDLPGPSIGESWEISGIPGSVSLVDGGDFDGVSLNDLAETYGAAFLGRKAAATYESTGFPLLIKFIDARDNLSLQVHPDERLARIRHNCNGKDEMWYVVEADPGAEILCGLKREMTPDHFDEVVKGNRLIDYVARHDSEKGQVYYIPAGTIHAICAGNLILEVQQTSDITYRIYDYDRLDKDGNPRQLHTDEAREAIDYTFPHENHPTGEVINEPAEDIVVSPHFKVDLLKVEDQEQTIINGNGDSFTIIVVIDGHVHAKTATEERDFGRGNTFLLSADLDRTVLSGDATILRVTI